MGLHAFEPQCFVGHITEGTPSSLVAANPGIAILALIDVLLLQIQSFCRILSINVDSGDESDDAAAITADLR